MIKKWLLFGINLKEEDLVDNYNEDIYVTNNLITELRNVANKRMSTVEIFFNNKYEESIEDNFYNYYNV